MTKTRWPILTGLLLGAVLIAAPASAQSQKELIVTTYGGKYEEVLKAGAKKFEDEHGVRIVFVPSEAADNLVKARNREVDVIHSDPIFALRLEAENLFEKIDEKLVPNLKHLHPVGRLSDYTVAANVGAYVLAYNPDRVEKPTSWFALADPKFKGKVALRGFRPENIELIVLFSKLAGGDERKPDAGFAKMKEISDNVHTYVASHAQMLELFKKNEVDIGVWTDGRIAWAQGEGAKVAPSVPKEGIFALVSTVNVIKGRPNAEIAQKYINHLLDPESSERMTRELGYFPTNAQVKLPADLEQKMVLNSSTIGQMKMADWKYLITVYDQWNERWQKEIVK
jgi:putative spermidine/putrescine transport system substrate-binding protein